MRTSAIANNAPAALDAHTMRTATAREPSIHQGKGPCCAGAHQPAKRVPRPRLCHSTEKLPYILSAPSADGRSWRKKTTARLAGTRKMTPRAVACPPGCAAGDKEAVHASQRMSI